MNYATSRGGDKTFLPKQEDPADKKRKPKPCDKDDEECKKARKARADKKAKKEEGSAAAFIVMGR